MKKQIRNWTADFGRYLWYHKGVMVAFTSHTLIFGMLIFLYDLPLEAWGYALLLCGTAGLVIMTVGFYRFCKRCTILEELQETIGIDIDKLPDPRNNIEERYEELLRALYKEKIRTGLRADKEWQDAKEYYTLWAHQIKTPIAAMCLLLQTSKDGEHEELQTELFKIEQYADMVLSYIRMDSSSTDYVIAEYDLDAIIRQTIRKYAPLFIRKRIRLDFKETKEQVLTDEKWLAFVIEQILSNALKYTPEGSISIYMNPEEKALFISDTGIGVAKEDLPRVFEKGYTGYNGRWEGKSTGIGLYLCKRILEKLSHTIEISSEGGVGTTVRIGLDSWKPFGDTEF